MRNLTLLALFSALLVCSCGMALQTAQEKKAEDERVARQVRQALDERCYEIDVDYMVPLRGGARSVSSYSVSVDSTSINSRLPYVGQVTSVPYGGGTGLNFKAKYQTYTDSGFVKDRREVRIVVKNEEDTYIYQFTIFDNGHVDISVHCRNRDDISFLGNLRISEQ